MSQIDVAPVVPGFYWAQWQKPWGDAMDNEVAQASCRWEVVEVFVNSLHDESPDQLMALLPGIEAPEPLANFSWGEGPLVAPDRTTVAGTTI